MKRIYSIFCGALLVALPFVLPAQTVPVGTPWEDAYRRAQLLGKLDSSIAFTLRPFFPSIALNELEQQVWDPDSSLENSAWLRRNIYQSANQKVQLKLFPVSWQSQYNSNSPWGWNDGSMIPARGYQTKLSGGLFARVGPLSFQLQPEYVYAANAGFEVLDIYGGVPDIVPRFGNSAYSEATLGQSSIRLTFGPVSLGLSNENIWWGPGMRSALVMSNNAQGFKHLTLNTVKPIRTPVGSFEMQLVGGRLESSDFTYLNNDPTYSDWRYLSAFNIGYQPRWLPGMFVGLTRSFQAYHNTLETFGDYFPFLTPYEKVKDRNQDETGRDAKDQISSVYFRWLFNKAKTEFYFEYGANDNAHNFRDFIGSPEHSRTYLMGVRKLIPLQLDQDEFMQVNAEFTQMQQTIDRIIRNAGDWYSHGQLAQGHTHKGKVLGAGIGPGGNLQSLEVSWIKGLKRLGLQFERLAHNNFFTADYPNNRKWVDFSAAAHGEWNHGNLFFNAELKLIRSLNYQWRFENYDPNSFYIPENDVYNFHGVVGVSYRF